MFTGLISDVGTITSCSRPGSGGMTLRIATSYDLDTVELGESIAVDGTCLTVTSMGNGEFEVDASPETLARTTLGGRKVSDRVHLERAARIGDRLGGHFVLGHVDGVGRVTRRERAENAWVLSIAAPDTVTPYLIDKGSVTMDGVSLTVNRVTEDGFEVAIVPFTVDKTNLGDYSPGRKVNLEADVLGKYVRKFVGASSKIDASFLAKHGFGNEQ